MVRFCKMHIFHISFDLLCIYIRIDCYFDDVCVQFISWFLPPSVLIEAQGP